MPADSAVPAPGAGSWQTYFPPASSLSPSLFSLPFSLVVMFSGYYGSDDVGRDTAVG